MQQIQLPPPAFADLMVDPHLRAGVAHSVVALIDTGTDQIGADIPVRGRRPLVISRIHGGFAIKERAVDPRHHRANALPFKTTGCPQRVEIAASSVAFGRREHAVTEASGATVDFNRCSDIAGTVAVGGGRTDAAGVDQLLGVAERTERHFEITLVLGEKWALVAEEGFDRAEIDDDDDVALNLAEIQIHGRGKLELAVRLPEHQRQHPRRPCRRRCRTARPDTV